MNTSGIQQMNDFFTSLSDGVIICDPKGRIQQMNPAAMALFEISSVEPYRDVPYKDFISRYHSHVPDSVNRIEGITVAEGENHAPFSDCTLFTVPSGREICVSISRNKMTERDGQALATVYLLHDLTEIYEAASNSMRANTAIFTLIKAIASIHNCIYQTSGDKNRLLPESIDVIGQQMTDLISQLLKTQMVLLMSFKQPEQRIHYVALSGLTAEQVQVRKDRDERYTLDDYLDQEQIDQLKAGQTICVERQRQRTPFTLPNESIRYTIWVPLFAQEQFAGALIIAIERVCTPPERDLINAVGTLITMIIDCVKLITSLKGENTEEVVLQETNQIINEFLNLASHELRTPLTVTMGNIQLALRRLEKLRSQLAGQSELDTLSQEIARVQNPLEYATQSTRLHERMISNIVDDSRIQANELELHIKQHDLIDLVQRVVRKYQQRYLERSIEIVIDPPTTTHIKLAIDADRIKQVLHTYLSNAIRHSPPSQPVTIRIVLEEHQVTVSVHDNGSDIPPEDQPNIWNRFYRAKGTGVQNELDLSQGLSLYLCRALIHLHHGQVGVESSRGHGKTFWFSLPLPLEN
ncbi:hypothetical protein KDA_17960 [Dictyobacter alpinus]|uniref:histidine kinase n=1 Tax=Dictyobacter alpinus TaxID=2014873 RepID=A0A402B4P9_9CHLR|nr:PAS domain-containing sensor histidine kinase [Dictyobacter alpinus]GCE26312.1 hypothetical protein KDA_17960 [Dictyobacter alpinus]